MITRRGIALSGLAAVVAPALASSAEPKEVRIGYLDLSADPLYVDSRGYAGLYTVEHRSPFPAAELAIDDAKAIGLALEVTFSLVHRSLAGEDPAKALHTLIRDEAIVAAILDLPIEQTISIASAVSSNPVPLFNARHSDPELRQTTCHTHLFHTIPSLDMLSDALAQGLLARNWKQVLVLQGQSKADAALSKSFQDSARKFALDIVDVRHFVLGNDPRQRDQNNVRLLTGGIECDVFFVADAAREFAPFVPYNTMEPRPVVGSEGLMPSAWHIYWERQGAPQLNRRFARRSGRTMTDEDWATWAASRAVVEALVASRNNPQRPLIEALLDPALTLELYKGFPGSFRPWNRQLRQPILLGTMDAVVGLAPVEGVFHKDNNLDTLGLDEAEFTCSP